MTGSRRLAAERVPDAGAERRSTRAPTSRPSRVTGCRAGRWCWRRSPTRGSNEREQISSRARSSCRRWARRRGWSRRSSRSAEDLMAEAVASLASTYDRAQRRLRRRAEVPAGLDDRAPAVARRARDVARHAAGDGAWRDLRPDRRRLRALRGRRDLDGAALREDALRQRAAGARLPARLAGLGRRALPARLLRDARLGAARDAWTRGGLLLGARRRLRGGRGQVLRVDRRPSCETRSDELAERRDRLLRRHRARQLRARRATCSRAAARSPTRAGSPRSAAVARAPLRARPPRARRQAPDLLERADDRGARRRRRRARAFRLPRRGGRLRLVRAGRAARRSTVVCCAPGRRAKGGWPRIWRTTRTCSRRCSPCTRARSIRAGTARR